MKRLLLASLTFLFPLALMAQKLDCATTLFTQPGLRYMHKLRSFEGDSILAVIHLPQGLEYDKQHSAVVGRIKAEGCYSYHVVVRHNGVVQMDTVRLTSSLHLQQPVPFMGWLSWNVVENEISTDVVRAVADAMVSQGLRAAGYRYLVIDDYWHAPHRDSLTHAPIEDPRKFPNGMSEAVDYVHSRGLKFGIYSDAGEKTCAGMFGSYGFENEDADQYARWGVDLLKYDYCYAPTDRATAIERYTKMGNALKNTQRDILFYMCEWGQRQPWLWAHKTGATCWRATYDTRDGWKGKWGGIGMAESIQEMKNLWAYSGVNRFNDADMMCVGIHGKGKSSSDLVEGVPGMTQDEYTTQFALWCMWASPLTLSFDLRNAISYEDSMLICNQELIAINQDPMGLQAELVHDGEVQLYRKELENGDVAIAVTNLTEQAVDFPICPQSLTGIRHYLVRDVVNRRYVSVEKGELACRLNPHETHVYRVASCRCKPNKVNDDKYMAKQMAREPKRLIVSDADGRVLYETYGRKTRIDVPENIGGKGKATIITMGRVFVVPLA